MDTRFKMLTLLVPLLLAAFVAAAVPASAQQQTNTLQINCTGGPSEIQPLGAPGGWNCQAIMTYAGGTSDPVNPATVTFSAPDAPSWANVIIAPTSLAFVPPTGQTEQVSQPFQISVALTQDAPAFQTQRITIQASTSAPAGTTIAVQPTQIAVTPGYFNLYNVRLDSKIGQGGPQDSVEYPIIIDNFSNGDTRFEFSLLNPDNLPSGFQPVVPEPIVLQSKATGGKQTSGQVTFQVYTPFQNGYVNEIGAMQIKVDSFYAPNTNINGASSQVSTLTQARGFYVPGPATPLVILGMLGAGLALTRMDRDE